jgi:hypothetical protein
MIFCTPNNITYRLREPLVRCLIFPLMFYSTYGVDKTLAKSKGHANAISQNDHIAGEQTLGTEGTIDTWKYHENTCN